MSLDVPSDLGMVGDAVELVANILPPGTLSPRRISFNLRTALAEALGNAIRYGNGEDPERVVRVYVELRRDFPVAVGEGRVVRAAHDVDDAMVGWADAVRPYR